MDADSALDLMMSYKTILVAVDLTEQSPEVLETARSIAARTGASVHIATVVKPLTQVYGGLDMAPIASGAVSFEEEAETQAQAGLEDLARDEGVPAANLHVLVGSPARELKTLAADLDADLIVIGSHGRHGMNRLLGSTANAVLHDAHCNVLAVQLTFA